MNMIKFENKSWQLILYRSDSNYPKVYFVFLLPVSELLNPSFSYLQMPASFWESAYCPGPSAARWMLTPLSIPSEFSFREVSS